MSRCDPKSKQWLVYDSQNKTQCVVLTSRHQSGCVLSPSGCQAAWQQLRLAWLPPAVTTNPKQFDLFIPGGKNKPNFPARPRNMTKVVTVWINTAINSILYGINEATTNCSIWQVNGKSFQTEHGRNPGCRRSAMTVILRWCWRVLADLHTECSYCHHGSLRGYDTDRQVIVSKIKCFYSRVSSFKGFLLHWKRLDRFSSTSPISPFTFST